MQNAKFHLITFEFDEVMLYYVRSPKEFSIFTLKPTERTWL